MCFTATAPGIFPRGKEEISTPGLVISIWHTALSFRAGDAPEHSIEEQPGGRSIGTPTCHFEPAHRLCHFEPAVTVSIRPKEARREIFRRSESNAGNLTTGR